MTMLRRFDQLRADSITDPLLERQGQLPQEGRVKSHRTVRCSVGASERGLDKSRRETGVYIVLAC